eukprot:2268725-Amphidinium_carterae.1
MIRENLVAIQVGLNARLVRFVNEVSDVPLSGTNKMYTRPHEGCISKVVPPYEIGTHNMCVLVCMFRLLSSLSSFP